MNLQVKATIDKQTYYRLIALWALCEAMLGGVIHALKIPVSGLIVGGCATVCICLLAFYVPAKGTILKATIIVAVFKMILSPQSPPMAYLAVFFQGIMGEFIFWRRNFYKISCLLLGIIALLESGIQRIVVLTLVYGNNFWKAINNFINELTQQKIFFNYSLMIGAGYIGLHIATGIITGWWAGTIPGKIIKWRELYKEVINKKENSGIDFSAGRKNKRHIKKGLFIIWIILLLLYLQSYFKIGYPLLASPLPAQILLRSILIVLGWYFIAGPLISLALKKWLTKKQVKSDPEIQEVLRLIPSMKQIITTSWKAAQDKKRIKRIILCSKLILVKTLQQIKPQKKIYILTGDIRSGKTSKLKEWSSKRKDVFGILTPDIQGKRFFMDAHTGEPFEMEAETGEGNVFKAGRFIFSKKSFSKAIGILRNASNEKNGWLVVDEIGPLELRGEGFCEIIKEIVNGETEIKILFVIRNTILEEAIDFFKLDRNSIDFIDTPET